jgi:hypothetical protein
MWGRLFPIYHLPPTAYCIGPVKDQGNLRTKLDDWNGGRAACGLTYLASPLGVSRELTL